MSDNENIYDKDETSNYLQTDFDHETEEEIEEHIKELFDSQDEEFLEYVFNRIEPMEIKVKSDSSYIRILFKSQIFSNLETEYKFIIELKNSNNRPSIIIKVDMEPFNPILNPRIGYKIDIWNMSKVSGEIQFSEELMLKGYNSDEEPITLTEWLIKFTHLMLMAFAFLPMKQDITFQNCSLVSAFNKIINVISTELDSEPTFEIINDFITSQEIRHMNYVRARKEETRYFKSLRIELTEEEKENLKYRPR